MDTCWTGLIGTSMLETTRSAAYSARYLWWALEAGEPRRLCRALAAEAAITSAAGIAGMRPETLMARARQIGGKAPGSPEEAFLSCMAAVVACNQGEWNVCLAESGNALTRYTECGSGAGWERVTATTYWLSARIMTGDWKGVITELPGLILDGAARGDRYAAVNLQLLSNSFLAEVGAGRAREAAARAEELQREWGQPRFDMQRFCAEMTRIDCHMYEGDAGSAWLRFCDAQRAMRRSELHHIRVLRVRSEYAGACCAIALAAREAGRQREQLLKEARRFSKWLSATGQLYSVGLGALTGACISSVEGDRQSAETLLRVALTQFKDAGMGPAHALCQARLAGNPRQVKWFAEQEIAEPARLLEMLAPGSWHWQTRTPDLIHK
jgi:hypothetical protein